MRHAAVSVIHTVKNLNHPHSEQLTCCFFAAGAAVGTSGAAVASSRYDKSSVPLSNNSSPRASSYKVRERRTSELVF